MDYPPELGGIIYQVSSLARTERGISFAGGYPDPALFDVDGLAQAFEAMFRNEFRTVLQYGDREGYAPLRARLAAFSGGPDGVIAPEQVMVVNGGQQGLELTTRVLLRPGDAVMIDSPAFPTALQLFQLTGLRGVTVASDADGLLPDSVDEICRLHAPKLIYVVPSFSNPGGTLLSLERRLRLLELAVQHRFHILEDDPYGHLYFDTPPPPSLLALAPQVPGARERVIHVSSLSKLVAPALRVGWIVVPPELQRRFLQAKVSSDIHSAIPTQCALEHYWASGRFEAHLPTIRHAYRTRGLAMDAALRREMAGRATWIEPRGGMFVWCRVADVADTRALVEPARARKVFFVPGVAFYPGAADADTRTLRLSFATSSVAEIDSGIAGLARAIDSCRAAR